MKKDMFGVKERYVIDEKGEKIAIMMDIEEYKKLLKYIEEIEDSLELKKAIKEEREEGVDLEKITSNLDSERGGVKGVEAKNRNQVHL